MKKERSAAGESNCILLKSKFNTSATWKYTDFLKLWNFSKKFDMNLTKNWNIFQSRSNHGLELGFVSSTENLEKSSPQPKLTKRRVDHGQHPGYRPDQGTEQEWRKEPPSVRLFPKKRRRSFRGCLSQLQAPIGVARNGRAPPAQ